MTRSRRIVPLFAVLALTAARPHAAAAQQPPPPDNGGMGGGGGPGRDMPPGGGPQDPAGMLDRMVRNLKRQLGADAATFDALKPKIETVVQLQRAIDGQIRPEMRGPPGGGGGPDGNGPPDMGGGGGGGGGGDNGGGPPGRRHQRGGGDQAAGPGAADDRAAGGEAATSAVASDLTAKIRALRATLRQQAEGDDSPPASDASDVAAQVKAVRDARAKAVDELAATRKALRALLKTPRQDAVLVSAGILD